MVSAAAKARARLDVRRSRAAAEIRQILVDVVALAADRRTPFAKVADKARRAADRIDALDAELARQTAGEEMP